MRIVDGKSPMGCFQTFSQTEMVSYYKNPLFKIDDQGIMRVDYGERLGIQYNPVAIEEYALLNYNEWLKTKDQNFLDAFFLQVDWLMSHFEYVTEDAIAIPYQFDLMDLKAPWYSALDAAQFLSVMSRAFVLTADEKYLEIMRKSRKFLMLPVKEGGVKSQTEDGYVWVEEYPSMACKHVLNGFQSVIVGLGEYLMCAPNDTEAAELYAACLHSLEQCANRYEKYFWLLYEAGAERYHFVSNHYMRFQAQQMRHLQHLCDMDQNINIKRPWLNYYWKWRLYYIVSPIRYIRMLPMSWQNRIFKVIATK